MNAPYNLDFQLEPHDNDRLVMLCGEYDDHIKQIERRLGVDISNRGTAFKIQGTERMAEMSEQIIKSLYQQTGTEQSLLPADVHLQIQMALGSEESPDVPVKDITIKTKRGLIKPKGANQSMYMQHIMDHDISFGIGPAGTGKTYLAVAAAVDALERQQVRRIVLTRPAVEAAIAPAAGHRAAPHVDDAGADGAAAGEAHDRAGPEGEAQLRGP